MNVYDLLVEAVHRRPDQLAAVDQGQAWTYRMLQHEIEQLANSLKEKGLGQGSSLGILGRNSIGFITAAFAGFKIGATVLPLSHQLKEVELHGILSDIKLSHCIHDGHGPDPIGKAPIPICVCGKSWSLVQSNPDPYMPFTPVPEAAYVRFTSGTTGSAKGVVISHRAIVDRITSAQRGLKITQDDRVLWVLPMAYHFLVSIVLYLHYGATIILCPTLLAETILDLLNKHSCTLFYGSPMHFRMLAADRSDRMISSLRLAISTSSGLPAHIAQAFSQRFDFPITQAYGIIEVGLPLLNATSSEQHPDAIGYALPGFEIGLLDETGHVVPPGSTGRLGLKGPGMFDAYLQPFTPRRDVLQNGWFMTGDLASMSEDGLVTIRGREKSVINVSGNKVFPEEVEEVLSSHPSILAARIRGMPHPLTGEIVEADLVLHNVQTIEPEEIIAYCRQRLSTYKVPQRIHLMDCLPETGTGKILRQ